MRRYSEPWVHPRSRGEYKKTGNNNLSKQVHPRSRGEYIFDAGFGTFDLGSSPLTRGIRIPYWRQRHTRRFIPAHAGNTTLNQVIVDVHWVHPRSRGEYARKQSDCVRSAGSSPLTRGILFVVYKWSSKCRFIPAHAGNTVPSSCIATVAVGSSPLTRGIHIPDTEFAIDHRFIPAHAGNTSPSL